VLVIPLRPASRLLDLSPPEISDLFLTVQKVQKMLARHYFKKPNPTNPASTTNPKPKSENNEQGSFNITIQDGKWAGQTVNHLHVHVIPRLVGDKEGDALYERLQGEEGNVGGGWWDLERRPDGEMGKFPKIEDEKRASRSKKERKREAEMFRREIEDMKEEGEW
jgi:bis(5'-adenosyl)-triphosphatase